MKISVISLIIVILLFNNVYAESEFTGNVSTGFGSSNLSKCSGDCNSISTSNSHALIGFNLTYFYKTQYIDAGVRAGLLDSLGADPHDVGVERIIDGALLIGKSFGKKYRIFAGPAFASNKSAQRYEYVAGAFATVTGKDEFVYGLIGFTAELWENIGLSFEYRYGSYDTTMSGEDRSDKGSDVGIIPVSFDATNTINVFTTNMIVYF